MSDPDVQHSRRARRGIARVEAALGETGTIEAAAFAQRWVAFLQFLLFFGVLGDTIFLLVARPYWLAASRSTVYLFRSGRFVPGVRAPVFEAALGSVRIERLRGGPLRRRYLLNQLGGGEYQIAVHRSYWKEVDRIEALLQGTG